MIVIQSFAKKILLTGALLALLPAGYAWADTYSGMGSALEDALEEELEMDKELDEAIEEELDENDAQDEDLDRDESAYTADQYLGFWEEDKEGEVRLTVTRAEPGWYGVEISWARSSSQVDMWMMTAKPADDGSLEYSDCSHYLVYYANKLVDRDELLYKDGTGRIMMVGAKRLVWEDDQDHQADGIEFVPLRSPLGGGL